MPAIPELALDDGAASVVKVECEFGQGSALYLGAADGKHFFVTAKHVVGEYENDPAKAMPIAGALVHVMEHTEARVFKWDPERDIAFLVADEVPEYAKPITFAPKLLASSTAVAPRFACGFPSGRRDVISIDGSATLGKTVGPKLQMEGGELPAGYSGGAIFECFGGRPYCVGMILKGAHDAGSTPASSVHQNVRAVIESCRALELPVRPNVADARMRPPWRAISIAVMSVVCVVAIGAGYLHQTQVQGEVCKSLYDALQDGHTGWNHEFELQVKADAMATLKRADQEARAACSAEVNFNECLYKQRVKKVREICKW